MRVGIEPQIIPVPQPTSVFARQARAPAPVLTALLDTEVQCTKRYAGSFWGINCQSAMDSAHFLSAGVVCFARGLNDTPKMAALLLAIPLLGVRGGVVTVAIAIAIGGMLSARKVAETMSHKITSMNHGQGFAANLATGLLVSTASLFGLPVSTTHVAVGSLLGIGLTSRQANFAVVRNILMSWFGTLPCAAFLGGLIFWLAD